MRTLNCLPNPRKKAPRLVLGLGGCGLAAEVDAHFRELGWDVARAGSAAEAGALAHRGRAAAVVMPADAPNGSSGLLACAKLRVTHPHARVVLVGPEDGRLARYARLAGAVGYLPTGTAAAAVARAVLGN